MADSRENGSGIFRQSSLSRMTSADDLDKYIKVTNPSVWAVLLAAILFIGGLMVWSATAIIPTTVNVSGVAKGNNATCWVNEKTAKKITEGGAVARVFGKEADVVGVSPEPFSKAEVKASFDSDFLAESVNLEDWNYVVTLHSSNPLSNDSEQRLVQVDITVSETHPIDLVLGNR